MYCTQIHDTNNACITNSKYQTKEEAADDLIYWLNPDKSSNREFDFYMHIKDGVIYFDYCKGGYSTTLFHNIDENTPKTYEELKQFFIDGNTLNHDGVLYSVLPIYNKFYGYKIKEEMYEEFFFTDDFELCDLICEYDIPYKEEIAESEKYKDIIGKWTDKPIDLSDLRERLLRYNCIDEEDEPQFIEVTQFVFDNDK